MNQDVRKINWSYCLQHPIFVVIYDFPAVERVKSLDLMVHIPQYVLIMPICTNRTARHFKARRALWSSWVLLVIHFLCLCHASRE